MGTHCRLVAGLSSLARLFILLEVQDAPPLHFSKPCKPSLLRPGQLSLAYRIIIGLTPPPPRTKNRVLSEGLAGEVPKRVILFGETRLLEMRLLETPCLIFLSFKQHAPGIWHL
jgi:hypothetical protein